MWQGGHSVPMRQGVVRVQASQVLGTAMYVGWAVRWSQDLQYVGCWPHIWVVGRQEQICVAWWYSVWH